jgi:hypothetical protein
MSLQELQQKIKNFQDVAKSKIISLGKFKITVIKPNSETQEMPLSMALHFLRNSITEIQKSKIKLKEFNTIQKSIKRLFQKFIDTNELISFDKGDNLFKRLNENESISIFNLLFCDLFREKIKDDKFCDECDDLKDTLSSFNNFKETYKECDSKVQLFEDLREKIERYQEILNSGNLKKIEEHLEDFRLFRSFLPLNTHSEYLIDIKNGKIVKI